MFYRFFLLCLVLHVSINCVAAGDPYSKIDTALINSFIKKSVNEYLVLMTERKVFHDQLPYETKKEKAEFVYTSLLQKAEISQKPIIEILKKSKIPYQSFIITNVIKVTSDFQTMKSLAERDDVGQIISNSLIKLQEYSVNTNETVQRTIEPEWGLKMIKADSVWLMGFKGQGITIGGQDTGYDWDVKPLIKKYKGFKDSTNINHNYHWRDAIHKNNPNFPDSLINPCGYNLKEPCDDNNHGTHTMGTMVGEDENNKIGVAPDSKWIACRNMDRGWGQLSTYLECFEWFLAPTDLTGKNPDPARAPHVINNSWYCSAEEGCNVSNFKIMEESVKNIKASGIVVVVSAGNSGAACGTVTGPPAFFEPSFSVGATDINDVITGFSSRGPVMIDGSMRLKPNVSAPGAGVRSVIGNGNFASFNGTSMAGPHVAGVVALILSVNPALAGKVDLIENIIESTANPKTTNQTCGAFDGSKIPNAVYGYGRIDALAAAKMAQKLLSETKDNTSLNILKINPNPSSEYINIILTSFQGGLQEINIFDANGKKITEIKLSALTNTFEIDISEFTPGMYFCNVIAGNKNYLAKFIKF